MGVRLKIKKRKAASYANRVKSSNKRRLAVPNALAQNPDFDPKATLKENYIALGLTLDPNGKREYQGKGAAGKKTNVVLENVESIDVEELKRLIEAADKRDRTKKQTNGIANEEEESLLAKLAKRHGDNWEAMERDRKLNKCLWTKTQIQKKMGKLTK